MKKINWRLTTDLVALFYNSYGYSFESNNSVSDNCVIFCSPDIKADKLNALRFLGKLYYEERNISNQDFELKIDKDGFFSVKSSSFPKSDCYYKVSTYNVPDSSKDIGYLISNLDNTKGYFPNYRFEIAFSTTNPEEIRFVCKEMNFYNDCLEELNRRTKCELFKKTKTWIPGHQYDTLEKTYIFLGKFKTSRKLIGSRKNISIKFTKDLLDYDEVYLYLDVNSDGLKDTEKKISDVFKNRLIIEDGQEPCFGIKELRKLPLAVNSGKVLENDLDSFDLRSLKKDIISRTLDCLRRDNIKVQLTNHADISIDFYKNSEEVETLENGNINLRELLLPMLYYSENKYGVVSTEEKEAIDIVYGQLLNASFIQSLQILKDNKSFDESVEIEKTIDSIYWNLSYEYLSIDWTKDLINDYVFNVLGIESEKFTEDLKNTVRKSWEVINNLPQLDFEFYYKMTTSHVEFGNCFYSRQRTTSCSYSLEVITLESLLRTGELSDIIKRLCKKAIEHSGEGVDLFEIKNVGTRKTPQYYTSINITLENIVKELGGLDNISESLKLELKKNNFGCIRLDLDLDIETIK